MIRGRLPKGHLEGHLGKLCRAGQQAISKLSDLQKQLSNQWKGRDDENEGVGHTMQLRALPDEGLCAKLVPLHSHDSHCTCRVQWSVSVLPQPRQIPIMSGWEWPLRGTAVWLL